MERKYFVVCVAIMMSSKIMVKKCGILLQIYDTNMRTQTVNDHFQQEISMHQEAVRANSRKKSSYFDREEQRKINTVKDEVYYKVFTSLYLSILRHERKLF